MIAALDASELKPNNQNLFAASACGYYGGAREI
jgi:hypothetical protein